MSLRQQIVPARIAAGGMSVVVTIAMKGITNSNASFVKSGFCCFILFSFFGTAQSAESGNVTVIVRECR